MADLHAVGPEFNERLLRWKAAHNGGRFVPVGGVGGRSNVAMPPPTVGVFQPHGVGAPAQQKSGRGGRGGGGGGGRGGGGGGGGGAFPTVRVNLKRRGGTIVVDLTKYIHTLNVPCELDNIFTTVLHRGSHDFNDAEWGEVRAFLLEWQRDRVGGRQEYVTSCSRFHLRFLSLCFFVLCV
jgi:hypothetical protein